MKALTCRLLALSLLPSGALLAAAATAPAPGISYPLQAQFTNHPPRLMTVGALPKATAAAAAFQNDGSGVTTTDGAGRIHGVQTVVSDLGGGTQAVFAANISGSILGRGKTNGDAAVYLAIKGANKATASQPAARMNLSFRGATGVTPNSQTINSAAPGFNIRLAPDGTTNSVERYDPWSGGEGYQGGWTTYQFEVHTYSINTVFTTNAPDVQPPLLVSNSVNAAIQTVDLAGYDHYNQRYIFIPFGTPIKTDREDGYYGTNSYGYVSMHAAGDTTTNVPLWVIAEYVGTYPCPECPSIYDYYTNLVYGVDIADLGNCLAAYHSFYDSETSAGYAPAGAPRHAPRCISNQCQTNYARSLIASVTTNTMSPTFGAVVKNGRCAVNCWTCIQGTLSGTISAGKARLVLKRSPAVMEESHEMWTRIPSAAGEESYLVQCCNENLTVLTNDTFAGTVQQSGRKLKLTGNPLNLSFAGSGNLVPQHGKVHGIYSAQLAGVGTAKGSALTLKGSTRTLITGYEILANAPPVVRHVANLAAGDAYTLAVTNTTSGRLQVPAQSLTVTNVQDNVVSVVTWAYPAFNVDNPYFKTNTVDNAIDSVIASGRVMGQKWVAKTIGFNLDAPYPSPLPLVPTP